jgi:hypothetical protein
MNPHRWFTQALVAAGFGLLLASFPLPACCPAPPSGKPVVNADQTVILIWDAATKTQHFIRQASFKSDADDFGFLVPTPTQPQLEESGNDAFPYLIKMTEPETKKVPRPSGGMSCGCSAERKFAGSALPANHVTVLAETFVAGFHAVVLEATSADVLVRWLKEHGYAFSPQVEAWAKPYVDKGWKITALRVAKDKGGKADKTVAAGALRLSFRTDQPLFPYREPDPTGPAATLGARNRLLRIYFIGDARYRGELTRDQPWTGKVAWAGTLAEEDRKKLLGMLRLPQGTGPEQWWLTEFEDEWPYRPAPADLTFARDSDQGNVRRPPRIEYVASPVPADVAVYALAVAILLPLVRRGARHGS